MSNAGGLGVNGTVGRDAAGLRTVVQATRELTDNRPFGVNHVVQFLDRDAFDVCIEERVPVLCFSFGDPGDFARRAHDAGAKVICQVTQVDQVEACLASGAEVTVLSAFRDALCRSAAKTQGFRAASRARELMKRMSVARNQRGALTQAGAGIAASRRTLVDFARPFLSVQE